MHCLHICGPVVKIVPSTFELDPVPARDGKVEARGTMAVKISADIGHNAR